MLKSVLVLEITRSYTRSTNNILHSIHCPPSSHSSINCCVLLSPHIYIPRRVDCCMFLRSRNGCNGITSPCNLGTSRPSRGATTCEPPRDRCRSWGIPRGGESYKHDVMMLVCEDLVFWDVALCAEAILLGWVPVHLVVRWAVKLDMSAEFSWYDWILFDFNTT